MSFFLSERHEEYCDWRISISPGCINGPIYRGMLISGCTFSLLGSLLGFFALVFRRLVLKDEWSSYSRGANLSLVFFSIAPLFSAAQFLLVLTGENPLASSVFWGLMTPVTLFSNLVYYSTLIKVLPSSIMLTSNTLKSTWQPSDQQRNIFLFSVYLLILFSHAIFIPLAQWEYLRERISLASILLRVGLSLSAVTIAAYSFSFYLVAGSVIRRLGLLLSQTKELRTSSSAFDAELLQVTLAKIKNNLFFCVFGGIQYAIFFLPLAFYPNFFINQACSIAYAFLSIALYPFLSLPLFVLFIITDFKKAYSMQLPQRRTNSTSEQSKKEKMSEMKTIGSNGNVDKIIQELSVPA